jgi:hypothetical protein
VKGQMSGEPPDLLMSEAKEVGAAHYRILALCWAGRVFDRYDLVLFTFLVAPIAQSFHLTRLQISWALGVTLGACALGGIAFGETPIMRQPNPFRHNRS